MQTWRLDTTRQTLVLAAEEGRLPQVVYWAAPLPMAEDLETIARAQALDVGGGMLDANPDLSICPEASRSFPGHPGLIVSDSRGEHLLPRFAFVRAVSGEEDGEAGTLTLTFSDDALGLSYTASFAVEAATHIITVQAVLEAEHPVRLHWLAAPVFPGAQLSDRMMDVTGRWCGEFQVVETPWSPGQRVRENRTGRTGHEHFPGLVVPCRGATNTQGEVYAFHYGWSGGHKMIAEELPDGRRQIQFGDAPGTERAPATRFASAPLLATYGRTGLNGCATSFQRHLRDRIVRFPEADRPRPVHYNCWEAVYFDHDLATLRDIATRAAALGAERFVLDDGWFGRRDDDTTSLGDWEIDRRKWPDGLTPLIAHVHAEGMRFGLWFEPEMVNPESALFRAHPDWALGPPDQTLGRGQMVLDMARGEVRDHLYERITAILAAHEIDYVKWDHNRVLPAPDAAQTRGTYALLDRLRAAFPEVEIESCASGGGRIDAGILARTHRVWLSDSNDALERLRMQHAAALFLPAAVTGSHVGPRRCHTSGRVHDIAFRAWVAAQRHMGFEMDPRELDAREEAVLREVTAWYKANRHWMHRADILRLDSADDAVIAEEQLAADGSRFVVFAGQGATSAQIAPRPLRLTGLAPSARYRVRLVNRDTAPGTSRGMPALKDRDIDVSGAWLMGQGLSLPCPHPCTMWVLEGERL
ncbi:MAG: alpha-galactosidase [Pseudomonadota bacterium]